MKQIWPLFCVALLAAPLGAVAAPTLDGLSAEIIRAGYVPKKKDNQEQPQRQDNNRGGGNDVFRQGQGFRARDAAPAPRTENRRDDRINRAMSVASRRGRVLDAGPQGGSIFWVRVATDQGRVDLLVDADSGRIIGER